MTKKAKIAGKLAAKMLRQEIALGPFTLSSQVARGGMGEVWRGVHREEGVDVAVKVITATSARTDETLEAFRTEVRATAGLNHPGVVMVFDHGTISSDVAAASDGHLFEGSPYMVMEYANRGSLSRASQPLKWRDLRLVMLSLLDALGHAHARGIIHRDLKPGNVLISGTEDVRPGLKLTDFGIAHVIDTNVGAGSHEPTMGTPVYMAPEQMRGSWRDYGPWTDFYALGCMVYKLATGHCPYQADDLAALYRLHLEAPLPGFKPRFPMPEGIVAWLERLMAKAPSDRFQCAADAAFALEGLDKARKVPSGELEVELADQSESDTLRDIASAATILIRNSSPLHKVLSQRGMPALKRKKSPHSLPIPQSWRCEDQPPPRRLLGTGLGLYGLRTIPLVNREGLRDGLWSALRDVNHSGRAQMMLLTGSAGVGKSRLVEWICQRAYEVGAATILEVKHSPSGGDSEGISGMLAKNMRCLGLPHDEALQRCEKRLRSLGVQDPYEWAALTEIMTPAKVSDMKKGRSKVHFARALERFTLVQRHIERLAQDRTVILWMDDVQWGADSLEFVTHILESQQSRPCPILLLLTARDEALMEAQNAWKMLRNLMAMPSTKRVKVEPLDLDARKRLVGGLLSLQGDLAAEVETRSGGNPQFAIHLVGDWVHRGVLEVGPNGFVLAEGEEAVLPDDLFSVWSAHIDRLLEGQNPQDRVALEVAALLGQNINDVEWGEACAEAKIKLDPDLRERLLSTRLARVTIGGWNFAHSMLRETLERTAREAGRWEALHAACAAMLGRLYPDDGHHTPERRGRHLHEARLIDSAAKAYLKAATVRLDEQDLQTVRSILRRRSEALASVGTPEEDVRWGEGDILTARGLIYQDKLTEAYRVAEKVQTAARKWRWHLLPQALRFMGDACRRRGDFDQAAEHYGEALSAFESLGDDLNMANTLHGLAEVVHRRGQNEVAADLTHKALKLFRKVDNDPGGAMSLKMLGIIAQSSGELSRSKNLFLQALEIFERIGHKFGAANTYNILADLDRFNGDLEAAEEGYRKSLSNHRSAGATGFIPQINIALVLLERGDYKNARSGLDEIRETLEKIGGGGFLVYVHAGLLACAPRDHDWVRWDEHFSFIQEALTKNKIVDRDLAYCAHLAADNAAAAGQRVSAGEAYRLALDQFKALGNDEKVSEVSASWATVSI